jgi:hypothetical protein
MNREVAPEGLHRKQSVPQRFLIVSMPEAMLDRASVNFPILLFGAISGPAETGFM